MVYVVKYDLEDFYKDFWPRYFEILEATLQIGVDLSVLEKNLEAAYPYNPFELPVSLYREWAKKVREILSFLDQKAEEYDEEQIKRSESLMEYFGY